MATRATRVRTAATTLAREQAEEQDPGDHAQAVQAADSGLAHTLFSGSSRRSFTPPSDHAGRAVFQSETIYNRLTIPQSLLARADQIIG
ncbi:MAG: hypothetical protein DMD83_09835 [Candidatus Rokuibacteriota bacterium]|nr:MAG: hypothetical protein DMD83_09835 [Candidatus Rokubacteria bacterium]